MVGLVGLVLLARVAAVRLVAHAAPTWRAGKALWYVGLVAVLIASPLLVAGGIPIGPPLIAQMVIMAVTVLLSSMFRSRARPGARAGPPRLTVAASAFVALGLVEWLVLRPGVRL